MIIELSGLQLVCNHTHDFSNRASSMWNHKYAFRPKLHDTKFNYYFITAILKSQTCWKWNRKRFQISFYMGNKWYDLEQKRCGLEQKWCDTTWMMRFRSKNRGDSEQRIVWIGEYIILLRTNQIYKDDRWFKMEVINEKHLWSCFVINYE